MRDDDNKRPQSLPGEEDEGSWTGSLYDSSREAEFDRDDDEGTGSSGKTGKIEVRIATGVGGLRRDDLLSPADLKRLAQVHADLHKTHVEKQRQTRAERAAIKEGRYTAAMDPRYRQGVGSSSHYKQHPISSKAQFSGIDKQVVAVPSLNEAKTNEELKDQLQNRLQNRYQNTPKFNPRPRPG